MIRRSITTLVILISLRLLCPILAADWPQWQGPDRTGVSQETGLLKVWPSAGPKLLWIFRDAGVGDSCVSIVGNRLYSMGGRGGKDSVYAVDLKTQKKLWSVEVGKLHRDSCGSGPRSTPTIDGNFLYAVGGHGDLVCIETATGRKVWSQALKTDLGGMTDQYGYTESPLVDGGQVVVTLGGEEAIAAFDKKTGDLKWCSTAVKTISEKGTYSSMIAIELGGVRQYVQSLWYFEPSSDRSVIGVRASDGKLLWKSPCSGAVNTPIFHSGCVYISSQWGCNLVKLTSEGGEFKTEPIYASKKEMCNYHGSIVLVGGYLYGWSDKGKGGFTCQDFKTGKTVWHKNPHPGMDNAGITYADGGLYCYHARRGDVLLIRATPTGYKEQGKFRIPEESKLRIGRGIWTHPVVADGKLYLRDQELIFCYDIRKSP